MPETSFNLLQLFGRGAIFSWCPIGLVFGNNKMYMTYITPGSYPGYRFSVEITTETFSLGGYLISYPYPFAFKEWGFRRVIAYDNGNIYARTTAYSGIGAFLLVVCCRQARS